MDFNYPNPNSCAQILPSKHNSKESVSFKEISIRNPYPPKQLPEQTVSFKYYIGPTSGAETQAAPIYYLIGSFMYLNR